MNKRLLTNLVGFVFMSSVIWSCRCKCDCSNNRGCTILTAAYKVSEDPIEQKKFCSTMNFSTDTIMQDSINVFYERYITDSTYVFEADSIYKKDELIIHDCIEVETYEKAGYACSCAK